MRKFPFVLALSGTAVAASAGVFVGACDSSSGEVGSPVQLGGGGNGVVNLKTDANPAGTTGVDGGGVPSQGPPPTGDANCGNTNLSTTRAPADILLVLDRSGSMNYATTGPEEDCPRDEPNCTRRWPALTAAVKTTLDSTAGGISWGLKLYSSPNKGSCEVISGVEVPISSTSVPQIEQWMDQTTPGNNTPTMQAVTAATAYLKTLTDASNKFILLATDGEPNCRPGSGNTTPNVEGTLAAIAAAKAAGFPVYVIGIGPSVGNLDNFAKAGGTEKYFPASSAEELTKAFAAISQAVTTCTFSFDKAPPEPNNVAVYLDGNLLAKDPANGWSFGGNTQTVVLNGKACEKITSGAATKVQILFGCAGLPPPPSVPIL